MTVSLMEPLAPLDVAPRLGRLRDRMRTSELDALLVTKLANVRYLTGFTGSAATLLVTGDGALFVTDGRYTNARRRSSPPPVSTCEIEIGLTASAQREVLVRAVPTGARLGLEDHSVTWAQQREYAAAFEGRRARARRARSSRSCAG